MRQSRFPLRINVGFVLSMSSGEYRDIPLVFSSINLSPVLELSDFKGNARFGKAGQGILLQGDFEAWVNQNCTRCLVPFPYKISTEIEELYALDERYVEEEGLLLPHDGFVDLAPLVREYLTMEIPIQPICKEDCKGLCPECGTNLNQGICIHQQES